MTTYRQLQWNSNVSFFLAIGFFSTLLGIAIILITERQNSWKDEQPKPKITVTELGYSSIGNWRIIEIEVEGKMRKLLQCDGVNSGMVDITEKQ